MVLENIYLSLITVVSLRYNRGVEQGLARLLDLQKVGCSIQPPATNFNSHDYESIRFNHQTEVFRRYYGWS